jgi:hypothetical protein
MSAINLDTNFSVEAVLPKSEVLEIHHSTISLHHAKEGYDYPTIRLPHTLSKLVGLPTRIYQTIHDSALAFLVVISPSDPHQKMAQRSLNPPP